jgi:integrase
MARRFRDLHPAVEARGLQGRLASSRARRDQERRRPHVPLTPELRAVLERQRDLTEALQRKQGRIIPWIFHRRGEPIRQIQKDWDKATAAASLKGLIPHDLRRTAVRNLERAGVPRSAAMKLVGHKTESIYRRYAITDEAMLQEAGAKLSALHRSVVTVGSKSDNARAGDQFSEGSADEEVELEAASGLEPESRGFADLRLNHLATPPRFRL